MEELERKPCWMGVPVKEVYDESSSTVSRGTSSRLMAHLVFLSPEASESDLSVPVLVESRTLRSCLP